MGRRLVHPPQASPGRGRVLVTALLLCCLLGGCAAMVGLVQMVLGGFGG